MRKVLIDTNIYSFAMKGDAGVVSTLRKIDLIAISSITIGDLLSGFKGASREEKTGTNSILFWILQELLFIPLTKKPLNSMRRF